MAEQQITIDEVKASVDGLLKQATDSTVPALTRFASLQEKRATRLANAEKRLKARLGENHPRVVALARAASAANQFKQSLSTVATRNARRPKVGPEDWLVFGRVLNGDGVPIPSVCVRVFDQDHLCDDLLGATETDEYGDFAVIYSKSHFDSFGDSLPDLYLKIEDAKGRLLYSSSDRVERNAGRAEYFEITLVG